MKPSLEAWVGVAGAVAIPLALGGCAHHPPRSSAAAAAKAPVSRFAEVDIAGLPRGVFPSGTKPPGPGTAFASALPGIYLAAAGDPPRVSGMKSSDDPFAIEIKDQPGSATAYCLAFSSAGSPHDAGVGLVTQTALPLILDEFGVRAERIVDDAAGQPRFELLRGWVSETRGIARQGEGAAPLKRLAAYEGVEVFAFVDDSLTRTSPSVDFVVRRPPLHRAAVRYAAFVARLPDGHDAAGACGHIRVALPVRRGDAASATVDVGLETEDGARRLRVQLGTLWLPEAPSAKATVRLDWIGPELDALPLPNPVETDEVETTSKRRLSR